MVVRLLRYLRFLLRDRRAAPAAASGPFARDGVEVVPGVLSADDCAAIVAAAEAALRTESYIVEGDCYLFCRGREEGYAVDREVRQFFGVEGLHPRLGELDAAGTLRALAEERVGVPLVQRAFSLQVDDPDTVSKRGWHVDDLFPHTYKVFVYLTDVRGPEDGPYTVVPGSHRSTLGNALRKVVNVLWNRVAGLPETEMSRLFSDREARRFEAPAGTAIVSTQTLVHKGWHDHHGARRLMLVVYLAPGDPAEVLPLRPGFDALRAAGAAGRDP